MSYVDKTLHERGQRYGEFTSHAEITQSLKYVMLSTPRWGTLNADQKEALEMVAHKIGRILNGDPDWADSWHDIAGYAQLVCDRLMKAATPAIAPPSMTEAVQESAGRKLADAPKIVRDWLDATDLSEEARLAAKSWLTNQPIVSAELGGGS